MAKLKMKRIELIAPLTDSKQIIELLQRRGVVELCENSSEELEQMNVAAVMGEFEKFRSTVDQALNILDKYAPERRRSPICSEAATRSKSMNSDGKPLILKRS